jgi:DNA-binding CsgD family transcriptional regulator
MEDHVSSHFVRIPETGMPPLEKGTYTVRKQLNVPVQMRDGAVLLTDISPQPTPVLWGNAIFEPCPGDSLRVRNSTKVGPYPDRLSPIMAESRSESGRSLTAAERAVVRLAALGMSYKEIAAELHKSPNTVDNQLRKIRERLGVRNQIELVRACADLL